MPARLILERPSEVRLGCTWTLRGEDGRRVEALYALRSDLKLRWRDVSRAEEFYSGA